MKYLTTIIFIFLLSPSLHSQVLVYDSLNVDSCLETHLTLKKSHFLCYDRFHKLTRTGLLINGKREGLWKLYMDGELLKCGKYKNDKKHGNWKEFYVSGKELFIGKYKNDLESGTWRVYVSEKNIGLYDDYKKLRLIEVRKYHKGKFLEKRLFDINGKCISIKKY